ncbi:MAG: sugar transferase [Paludibacteraceae bacterium]|nr:sugar transferase [Paludibacteraceae bacterium]
MRIDYKTQLFKYICADTLSCLLAWATYCLLLQSKFQLTWPVDIQVMRMNELLWYGLPIVWLYWMAVYSISGYYNREELLFKSPLTEFLVTITSSLVGTLVIFFFLLTVKPDPLFDRLYEESYFVLLGAFFGFTYLFRLVITHRVSQLILERKVGFSTLVLGVGNKAEKFKEEIDRMRKPIGYDIRGFVNLPKREACKVEERLVLGSFEEIDRLITEQETDIVVIAVDGITESEVYHYMHVLCRLNVKIKLLPTNYQLLTGAARMDTLRGIPMVDLTAVRMSGMQKNVKRLFDVAFSLVMLIVLIPVYLFFLLIIREKPIYCQERIGLHGKPFTIYKFRTMLLDAEAEGPCLAQEDDSRVTSLGGVMRKYRLDELPQFYNVLRGDMSLVGPRPERSYFINQIVQTAPYYYMLSNVRPGLTSLGMVKYGTATTLGQLIERADYDVLYVENMSLSIDIKIALYTVKTIVTGEGL